MSSLLLLCIVNINLRRNSLKLENMARLLLKFVDGFRMNCLDDVSLFPHYSVSQHKKRNFDEQLNGNFTIGNN